MKHQTKTKLLSIFMAVCMVLTMMPVSVFAAESDNLCDHHTEHTADCGYVAAVAGVECTCTETDDTGALVHTEGCGYVAAQDESPCAYECTECAASAEAAEITGMTVSLNGEVVSGDVTITEDDELTYTVSGKNLNNANENMLVSITDTSAVYFRYFDISADGTTATYTQTINAAEHSGCNKTLVKYTDSESKVYDCGVTLTYVEKAETVYVNIVLQIVDAEGGVIDGNALGHLFANVNGEFALSSFGSAAYTYIVGEAYTLSDWECNTHGYVCPTEDVTFTCDADGKITITSGNATTGTEDGVNYIAVTLAAEEEDTTDEENGTLSIGDNEIVIGAYTYTAEQDGTLCITVTELNWSNGTVNEGNLTKRCDITINGTAITSFDNTVEVTEGDIVTVELVSLDGDTYYGTVNLSWTASEVDTSLSIGDNDIVIGTYTYTAEQDGTLYITVTKLGYGTSGEMGTGGLGSAVDVKINGTAITSFDNTVEVKSGDIVTVELVNLDDDTSYHGTVNLSWTAPEDSSDTTEATITVTKQDGTELADDGDIYEGDVLTVAVSGMESPSYYWVVLDENDNDVYVSTANSYTVASSDFTDSEHLYLRVYEGEKYITFFAYRYKDAASTEPAVITGVSITVDGETYTSGDVIFTPEVESIVYTLSGTSFVNLSSISNLLYFSAGGNHPVSPGYGFEVDDVNNIATRDFVNELSMFIGCSKFEVQYSNDGGTTWTGTGIYLTYLTCDHTAPGTEGSTITHVEAKTATCTETGNVEYWRCTECGGAWQDEACTTEVTDVTVAPLAHSYEAKKYHITSDYHYPRCDNCDYYLSDEGGEHSDGDDDVLCDTCDYDMTYMYCEHTAPDTEGSTIIHVEAKAATCAEAGNVEYWRCTECGGLWQDADCTTGATDVTISTLDHSYDGGLYYVAFGYHYTKCDRCDYYLSDAGEAHSDGDDDVLCDTCGSDMTPAEITGISITVEGHEYTEGNVSITAETKSLIINVSGSNLGNATENHIVKWVAMLNETLDYSYTVNDDGTLATKELIGWLHWLEDSDNFELNYSNDGGSTWTGTEIYLTYLACEHTAVGTEGSTITYVEAKAATCSETGNKAHWSCTECGGAWQDETCTTEATDVTIATLPHSYEENGYYIASGYHYPQCDNCDYYLSDEGGEHSDGEDDDALCDTCGYDMTPAEITGVSITVDGITYTSGPVTITAESTVTLTITGVKLNNMTTDNRVKYANGITVSELLYTVADDETTAEYTTDGTFYSDNTTAFELAYSNDWTTAETYTGTGIYLTYDDGSSDEENGTLSIGNNDIVIGTYTYTAEQDGTLYITVNELYYDVNSIVSKDFLGSWCDITINGTAITSFDNTVEVTKGDIVTVELLSKDGDTSYHGTVNLSWTASESAKITGVSVTVDDETYTKGDVKFTDSLSITVTGTNLNSDQFANVSIGFNSYDIKTNSGWTISEDGTTAELDLSDRIEANWLAQICLEGCVLEYKSYNDEEYIESELNLIYVPAPLEIGEKSILPYIDYTFTAEQAGSLYITIKEVRDGNGNPICVTEMEGGYGVQINGERITKFMNVLTVEQGDEVTILLEDDYNLEYFGTVLLGWQAPTLAQITGVSVTVDDKTYTSGNVTITSESEVAFTVTGADFDNLGTYCGIRYNDWTEIIDEFWDWEIDTENNTAYLNFADIYGEDWIYYLAHCENQAITYSSDGGITWSDTGICLTYDDGTSGDDTTGGEDTGEEETTPAVITGVSITVDGITVDSTDGGHVFITPYNESVFYTVSGTDFANLNPNNVLEQAKDYCVSVTSGSFTVDTDANTAKRDYAAIISDVFEGCENFEVQYSNDGGITWNGTGIYLTYLPCDHTEPGVDGSTITHFEAKGATCTETGNVEYWNCSECGGVWLDAACTDKTSDIETEALNHSYGRYYITSGYHYPQCDRCDYYVSDEGAVHSDGDDDDALCDTCEYDTTPVEITDVSITVDGITYTSGDVTITTDTKSIIYTVSGSGFVNVSEDHILRFADGYIAELNCDFWTVDSAANIATSVDFVDCLDWFENCSEFEVQYSDDGGTTWIGTGIYLTYDPGTGEEDTLSITKQPTDASGKLGEIVSTTVEANGENLKYQWYFRKVGAESWSKSSTKTDTYSVEMTKARNNRELYCVITDANGETISTEIVTLTALPEVELAITTQPNDASAKLGETFCVTIEAEGDGLSYRWYWRQVGTETWKSSAQRDNTYDAEMTSSRHNREVYCVITDACGNSVSSDIATITGTPTVELAITTQPEDQIVTIGENYNVTFEAVGDGLKYQWYYKNADSEVWRKSAHRDNSYDDVMIKRRHNRSLYCVVTDAWGNTVTTNPIVVIMAQPKHDLQLITAPTDASAKLGEEFCVTLEAQGDELSYRWYWRNAGTETWCKSGQRDNTYDSVMTKARHNREVYCVITDMWGESITTDVVTISGIPTAELAINSISYEAVAMGEEYCATVDAVGDGLTYTWYFKNEGSEKWSNSSVRDNTYNDTMTKSRANREVYCVVTDAWGNSVQSETVTLTVSE